MSNMKNDDFIRLKVDSNRKKEILQNNINQCDSLKFCKKIIILSVFVIFVIGILPILYILIKNYVTPKYDRESLAIIIISIASCTIFPATGTIMLTKLLYCCIAMSIGHNLYCNENILISNKELYFIFAYCNQKNLDELNAAKIPLDENTLIAYDDNNESLTFKGYSLNQKAQNNKNEFKIFDYFEPSLKDTLMKENKKILIEKGETHNAR